MFLSLSLSLSLSLFLFLSLSFFREHIEEPTEEELLRQLQQHPHLHIHCTVDT